MARTRVRQCNARQDDRRAALEASLRRFLDSLDVEDPRPPTVGDAGPVTGHSA